MRSPLDFFGDLKTEYEKRNADYIASGGAQNTKHDEKKEYTVRPVECSTRPIHYDPKLCIGCNRCVDTCQCDILMPNQEKGKATCCYVSG